MSLDVPKLIKSALPESSKNKNVAILRDNWTSPTSSMNHNDPSFLSDSFPRSPPKLFILGDDDTFDPSTLSRWRSEGFSVEYLPMGDDPTFFTQALGRLYKRAKLGPCEIFGIVAYGEAAALSLEYFHVLDNNKELKLGLLVAYYPTRIPDLKTRFPSAIRVVVHLCKGEEMGLVKQSQMVGIQGKKRVVKWTVPEGMGAGGLLAGAGYKCFVYEATSGWAEGDLDEYDTICAERAWGRSVSAAKRAFRVERWDEVEEVVERNAEARWWGGDVKEVMGAYVDETSGEKPQVTAVPTLSGGVGAGELEEFYERYWMGCNPESLEITLLSRTMGVDRVVDEMFVSFKHTQDMPWILPGVPPTKKRVEVIMVSIIALRGGKLYHERIYWDQASVLVQVGLLDPKMITESGRKRGVKQLPVVGRKAARRIFSGGGEDEGGEADNQLIYDWEDSSEDEESGEEEEEEENNHNATSTQDTLPERSKKEEGNGVNGQGSSEDTHEESSSNTVFDKGEKESGQRATVESASPVRNGKVK